MSTATIEEKKEVEIQESHSDSESSLPVCHRLVTRTRSGRCIKQKSEYALRNEQKRQRQSLAFQVRKVLAKEVNARTQDDTDLLTNCAELVKDVNESEKHRQNAAEHQEIVIDDENELEQKCAELARLIRKSKCCVVYTGAGLSTSASIPDYRGPNGLWTQLNKGIKVSIPDFSQVNPTYSHMALSALMKAGLVNYIVSQNCDGLHYRSGIDPDKLSELHGNCFIEFCTDCYDVYLRDFDVTEKTSFRKHSTGRFCKACPTTASKTEKESNGGNGNQQNAPPQLRDSIVHFGEKLRNGAPYNWEFAKEHVKSADLIICIGSSLKVLKHYACLWPKTKKQKEECSLVVVNIQWTSKDRQAILKVNGYADQVLERVVKHLNVDKRDHHSKLKVKVDEYNLMENDHILNDFTPLEENELETTSKRSLSGRKKNNNNNRIKEEASGAEKIEGDVLMSKKEDDDDQDNYKNENGWYSKSFKKKKSSSVKKNGSSVNNNNNKRLKS